MAEELSSQQSLDEGLLAPDFSWKDLHNNTTKKLSDYRGKKRVVIYFYPKDFTPGCTAEATEFVKDYKKFQKEDIEVLGVSPDNEESHTKFKKRMGIPYPLVSDTENEISKKYGVYGLKSFMGRDYMGVKRVTFLVDKNGRIIKIFRQVIPKFHSQEVFDALSI
jgi:peroxiredoxin Q/BCP